MVQDMVQPKTYCIKNTHSCISNAFDDKHESCTGQLDAAEKPIITQ